MERALNTSVVAMCSHTNMSNLFYQNADKTIFPFLNCLTEIAVVLNLVAILESLGKLKIHHIQAPPQTSSLRVQTLVFLKAPR